MKWNRPIGTAAALVALACLIPAPLRADDDPRVYLRLAEGIPEPIEEVVLTLEDALRGGGWNVLTTMGCGIVADRCDHRSHVVVAYRDSDRERLMAYGNHAAFAVPVRFVVYEDERGVGIGSTNPMNLNRTIVDEESAPAEWADIATGIRGVVAEAFPAHVADTEYGQEREKARIGRTFGIMAGGKFTDKLEEIVSRPADGDDAAAVAHLIADNFPATAEWEWEWGIRPVYVLELPENDMAIVGMTALSMEAKAADIVGDGGLDERADMACPGIDHAAAFPIEISVELVDGEVQVRMVDVMYRMKMFFEDAGKMAFARNMGMPGSIEGEIKERVRLLLN